MPIKKSPATRKKATKTRSVGRPRKASPTLVRKTIVTIHPDGIVTVEKFEETVTEQMMLKAEA